MNEVTALIHRSLDVSVDPAGRLKFYLMCPCCGSFVFAAETFLKCGEVSTHSLADKRQRCDEALTKLLHRPSTTNVTSGCFAR